MSNKNKLVIGVYGLLSLGLVFLVTYQTYTFYSYPCEAFKTGYLSIGYAPARCIK